MSNTFQQIRFHIIILLCFALIFQPELASQANGQSCIFHNNDRLLEEVTDGNSIDYDYDDNGSLIQKVDGSITSDYTYDLRGRLASVHRTGDVFHTCYRYNPDGIRVQTKLKAGSMFFPYREYLIDPYNHTGYAQVFREADETTSTQTVYILGNDVLAQATDSPTPKYFLYDGHGSVRQLTNSSGSVIESYSYDAYGVMLGGNPTPGAPAATLLLYAGEYFDTDSQHYYNRARWYDPLNGRFNRLDPYSGNNLDPQSLHKYLYCHADPVNGIDPSGQLTLTELKVSVSIYIKSMATMVKAAFAAGGAAIGRLWNAIGTQVQIWADQVFNMFPRLQVFYNTHIGNRIIDYTLRYGNKTAHLEVKYRIPTTYTGDAFNRLVEQINAMVSYGQGRSVIWTLREPTVAQLTRIQQAVGPVIFNQVQFVHSIDGLYNWIQLFFNI